MKKFNWRIVLIIILIIILAIMIRFYLKNMQSKSFSGFDNNLENFKTSDVSEESPTITASSEVTSSLSENLELHATYYLEECYVEENQEIKQGENILKYTNGEYLVAPYDCVITEINIPESGEKCTNSNYIAISSLNNLEVQISIDEDKIDNIDIGDSASVKISALDNQEFEGYVTKIGSIASNGKFTVTIEFENDGNVKIGMSAKVEIA